MVTSETPDFKIAMKAANKILAVSKEIKSFPFSPIDLVSEQSTLVCRSYQKASEYGVNLTDFGSESAGIFKYHDKGIIFYDCTKPEPHIAFSILHEFGHHQLQHDFGRKDTKTYHKYEVEANFFAAQLLMPEQLIRDFARRGLKITRSFLQSTFAVSAQAADKRLITLAKMYPKWQSPEELKLNKVILFHYTDFLNEICELYRSTCEKEYIYYQQSAN